ncbi:CpcT/CpeT family chromophore lyase [uncultured Maribacter sp.]|uniref:CpcT/CpeT family chromophore lyase n=1 Tax=uncultured Maribacter sp. TaxID=431308 RepID=UPI00263659C2|nr:CpcT/CpeT family chromophore lyase [uncultured Maribacter sp.]
MKTITSLFFIISMMVTCYAQNKSLDSLETELNSIMNIWPGKYNNDKQIAKVKEEGGDVWLLDDTGKDGYLQIESHYVKLNNPAIGEHVLYVEEYRDHQPDSTYRQRIYTLTKDDSLNIIRVKMWPFKDKKKYVGAYNNSELLNSITAEEISAYPDKCDLLVKKEDGKFNMYMNGTDCAFGDKCFNYQVLLSENIFSYRDKITKLSTGETVSTAANYAYHDLDRIK